MNTYNHPVFWPGWITKGRICGQGYGSLWELLREDGNQSATVKYISIPRSASEIILLLKQGKSAEQIAAHYDHMCRRAEEEYTISRELAGCRHVALYQDMRKVRTEDGLGWTILLMADALKPLDKCDNIHTEAEVLKLGKQICLALADSSRCGLLHGRISPRCIFRDDTGNYRLGGFAGEYCGDLGDFRAPEVTGNQFTDSRADVYSLGMVLYWLLNNQDLPGNNPRDPKNGSAKLKSVIMKAIAPKAQDRYQNPAELWEALTAISPRIQIPKLQKVPSLKAILATMAVLLLTGLCTTFISGPKTTPGESLETTPPAEQQPAATIISPQSSESIQITTSTETTTTPTVSNDTMVPVPTYMLMEDEVSGFYYAEWVIAPVFGSKYQRNQIRSITFVSSIEDASENSWDVSWNQNGTVLAWVKPNGNLYDLMIGAEGGVVAPKNCRKMFAGYNNLLWIDFNGAFDTSNATDMRALFEKCSNLREVDVSTFDTSNVINMRAMFCNCSSLMTLDVSGFDTSNVVDMDGMFYHCDSLRTLDVSGFDTSNVTIMKNMFFYCSNLTNIDVSHFDVSNVTDYTQFMNSGQTINGRPWEEFFRK